MNTEVITAEKFVEVLKENNIYNMWIEMFKIIHKDEYIPQTDKDVLKSLKKLQTKGKSNIWFIPFVHVKTHLVAKDILTMVEKLLSLNQFTERIAIEIDFAKSLDEEIQHKLNKYISNAFTQVIESNFDSIAEEKSISLFEKLIKGDLNTQIILLNILQPVTPKTFLNKGFEWRETSEGGQYWAHIDGKLDNYYIEHASKEAARIFKLQQTKRKLELFMSMMKGKMGEK